MRTIYISLKIKLTHLPFINEREQRTIINKNFKNKKTMEQQQELMQEQLDNNEEITAQLQELEENINFISSSGNNFNQDERLVVVGTPRSNDNQRTQGKLLGQLLLSLQY